jgi:hypothetical protein
MALDHRARQLTLRRPCVVRCPYDARRSVLIYVHNCIGLDNAATTQQRRHDDDDCDCDHGNVTNAITEQTRRDDHDVT